MKLVTWNVNSLNARLPRVLEFLELHAPDVACLQETKCEPDAFPARELADVGYAAAHHSVGRWGGVAILARQGLPLGDAIAGLPGEHRTEEARWIEATAGDLRVASTYVTNGRAVGTPTFDEKLAFLDAMRARLAGEGAPALVAGDFNVAPADLDVYDPEAFVGSTHVTDAERSRLQGILDDGYVDAFRAVNGPEAVQHTWWDYRQGHFHRGLGLRIDLVLVRADLAAGLRHCGIERDFRKGAKPSDHAPLVVELDVP
ncbi:MAG: exodeoxyribonuclease [Solirubrobacteraceae bacterium]|jgi:exodeoxyribonuclease-3|nr:exodeoxyribonuclease [Solirubrobacteraceae bacterium]